ncbi:MAG: carbohydrate ABC transporter permease [Armatimonadota bacterium]
MANILPFIWIFGVLSAYTALWLWITDVADAVRMRKANGWGSNAVLLAVPALAVLGAAVPAHLSLKILLAGVLSSVGSLVYRRLFVSSKMTWRRSKQRKEDSKQTALHLVLITGSIIFIMPFVWLITTSLKEDEDMFKYPPVWIPRQQVKVKLNGGEYGLAKMIDSGKLVAQIRELPGGWLVQDLETGRRFKAEKNRLEKVKRFAPVWRNYTDALTFLPEETLHGAVYLFNTVFVTVLNIIGVLLSSSLVAFSFARLRWPGRDVLFVIMLSTMMLPAAVTLIPVFLIYKNLGWVDTLRPLWFGSFFAAPFNVFLLRQFFLTIPLDLEDAAKIDGCSYLRIYWNIMLPLVKPALAALTIMAFLGSWNNFMGPLIYISSPEKMTLAYALRLFQSAHSSEYGMLMAAATMVMLPVLLVFFFTQRHFIQGITLTGLKQ